MIVKSDNLSNMISKAWTDVAIERLIMSHKEMVGGQCKVCGTLFYQPAQFAKFANRVYCDKHRPKHQ